MSTTSEVMEPIVVYFVLGVFMLVMMNGIFKNLFPDKAHKERVHRHVQYDGRVVYVAPMDGFSACGCGGGHVNLYFGASGSGDVGNGDADGGDGGGGDGGDGGGDGGGGGD